MAEAFQGDTIFGDEQILGAQSQLLTFTKITRENFEAATQAVLDLSTRMGTDLKSSVLQVGKALNDPVRGVSALAEAGIQFSDDQRTMINRLVETNQLAEAQRVILAELETQFGGSARAARDTFGGALAALQNAAGDLLEGEGGGLTGVVKAVNDLTDLLQDPGIRGGMQELIRGLAAVGGVAAKAASGLGQMIGGLRFLISGPDDPLLKLDDEIRAIDETIRQVQQSSIALTELGKRQIEELRARRAALVEELRKGYEDRGAAQLEAQRTGATPPPPVPVRAATTAVAAQLDRDLDQALEGADERLRERLEEVRQRLLAAQGETAAARRAALEAEFEDLIVGLQAKGDQAGVDLVRRLINVEVAKARLTELEAAFERTAAGLARQEQSIQAQVETGAISQEEGRRRINALYAATAARLREVIPLMEELARVSGDPAAVERVEALKTKVDELKDTATDTAGKIGTTFRDAGEQAFAQWLSDLDSLGEAFRGFLKDLQSQLARLASQQLFDGIFSWFSAGVRHGGGIAGSGIRSTRKLHPAVFAAAPRLHSGGLAGDEVPAILRRGEEVLTRSDPRHVLNGGRGEINLGGIHVSGTSDPALVLTAAVQAADIVNRSLARRRR